MINTLIIEGNIVKDFDLINDIAKSSIAVKKYGKDEVFYVELTAFGKVADYCVKYLRKGNKVIVDGQLEFYKDRPYCTIRNISKIGGSSVKEEKAQTTPTEQLDNINLSDENLPF